VLEDLHRLAEPATLGDPMRPLLLVSKSREKLAVTLRVSCQLNILLCSGTDKCMLMAAP
jgi:hypothetical protein